MCGPCWHNSEELGTLKNNDLIRSSFCTVEARQPHALSFKRMPFYWRTCHDL